MKSLVNSARIKSFCQRWKIQELALFGSALPDDFRPDSDIDLLVSFDGVADWSLLEHVQMQLELQELLGRNIDLVSKRALKQSENWIRRDEILQTAVPVFVKTRWSMVRDEASSEDMPNLLNQIAPLLPQKPNDQ